MLDLAKMVLEPVDAVVEKTVEVTHDVARVAAQSGSRVVACIRVHGGRADELSVERESRKDTKVEPKRDATLGQATLVESRSRDRGHSFHPRVFFSCYPALPSLLYMPAYTRES
jgi:hypothetical protein